MSLSVRLRHQFPGFLLHVDFSAPAGVTALFGRSGSGKTTVINGVAGLLRADQGRVEVDGTVLMDTENGIWLPPHKRQLGYVFQEGRLFPHLTVRQNLLYGRLFSRGGQVGAHFDRVVELLDIASLLTRRPDALSGGEKQRVAIGRALLARPRILLLDEPLAALDEQRKSEILPYLEKLHAETGVPVLYVSHSLAEVARLAHWVIVLEKGKVSRAGPALEVIGDPALAPQLGIREAGSILSAAVARHHSDGLSELCLPDGGSLFLPRVHAVEGQTVHVRVLAQDVMISLVRPEGLSALNVLPARVSTLHAGGGPGTMVGLRLGDDAGSADLQARITARSAANLGLEPGMPVFAVIKSVAVAQRDIW